MEGQYHEPVNELSQEARDKARAYKSLIEELEAADWYDQRVATEMDPELRAILIHNRNEEIEHATIILEWIRRRMPEAWNPQLEKYLFCKGDILSHEHDGKEGSSNQDGLKIGKIK
ncbi:MAG: hypothetical protein ACRC9Q_09455 [Bacteroidales bacterium]